MASPGQILGFDVGPVGPVKKQDLPAVVAELQKIEAEHDDELQPEFVVEAAQSAKSPLHKYFEWDDTEAARRFRLRQAQSLIKSVQVVIERAPNKPPLQVPLYYRVTSPTKGRVYATVSSVFSSEDGRAQIISKALKELNAWKKRYASYSELASLVHAINTFKVPDVQKPKKVAGKK